jgi:Protein of unknown function (DUF3089)
VDGRPVRTHLLLSLVLVVAGLAALPAASSAASTVWLCKPGTSPDPCNPGLTTTRYSPSLQQQGTVSVKADKNPKIDCFYVYPTVSDQTTTNANLTIDPEQNWIALYQAARYSQHCKVYAPMYRQLTLKAIIGGTTSQSARKIAYGDVRSAWKDYLKNYNKGRGVVLIGHSQGSFVLRQLIKDEVDPRSAVRKKLVSAILLGGNVLVKKGKRIGGDFNHVPACTKASQTGCVIAWSTYNETPPADSRFGRVTGADLTLEGKPAKDLQVLCTNPAALGGGSGNITPIHPTKPPPPGSTIALAVSLLNLQLPTASTTWITAPDSYKANCSTAGGANVLNVTALGGAPVLKPSPSPTWGLHLEDANVALGNLVDLVASEAKAYAKKR